EVKRRSADGSVGSPHARVGHCQASNQVKTPCQKRGVFAMCQNQNQNQNQNQKKVSAIELHSESWKPNKSGGSFFMYSLKTQNPKPKTQKIWVELNPIST
ncbi:hypothetical protein, partial [Yersinia mollaretii]|uniref:hypothetical protein n=1 Tax=Yersinia mollaretii TaxID=33060 RepID=UPI001C95F691